MAYESASIPLPAGALEPPRAFTQTMPPYVGVRHAGAGVEANFTNPSGSIRWPIHIPSFRYNIPSRAQLRAVP